VPVVECAHLSAIREGRLPFTVAPGPAVIEPLWDASRGPPYVSRVEVSFAHPEGELAYQVPVHVLREAVQDALAPFVDGVRLKLGDPFHYWVTAYPVSGATTGSADGLALETVAEAHPPALQPMAGLLAAAERHGGVSWHDTDLPIFIPERVLEEAVAAATDAGEREAAGVLLGRFARDPEAGTVYLNVTAQVPAREAVADEASFTFTGSTWAAVSAALALRGAGERIVGWHHSHPRSVWPCAGCECPPERRPTCPSRHPFFSPKDVHLHRTVFQSAFNVALVVSFQADPRPRLDLFGWRWHGVAPRGFYRVGPPVPGSASAGPLEPGAESTADPSLGGQS
jgi:proteasome lid subunit RPN8/RPN11